MIDRPLETKQRLIDKACVRGDCILWTGYRNPKGYGRIAVSTDGKKTMALAHRLAWRLFCGPIPDGLLVLHLCDVPACIRPEHLFLGTNLDNQRDSISKGRARKAVGQRNGKAKLTDKQVAEIRRLRKAGLMYYEIGERFGTPKVTIGAICRGERR